MKPGDILIAIDPCKMNGGNTCALTVGREYSILGISNDQLRIKDNQGDVNHWYNLEGEDGYTKWFRKKETNYEIY